MRSALVCGDGHPCREAEADSHELTAEILQFPFNDKVVYVLHVQFSSADVEETAEFPQLRRFARTLALHKPVVVQRQVPYGR